MWIENARHQAYLISTICAVLGVAMGFVVYLDFAHTFEQNDLAHQLWVLAISMILGTALAGVSELLRETIREGEVRWQGKFTAILTTAIILISFELFTHVTESAIEQKSALQNIAAGIAGRNTAALTDENTDFSVFLSTLEKAHIDSLQPPGPGPSDPAKAKALGDGPSSRLSDVIAETVREKEIQYRIENSEPTSPAQKHILQRIVQLMPIAERVPLFTFDDPNEIRGLSKSLRSSPQEEEYTLPWEYDCSLDPDEVEAELQKIEELAPDVREQRLSSMYLRFDTQAFRSRDATPEQKRAILDEACRRSLVRIQKLDKVFLLRKALNSVLTRPDLYDKIAFNQIKCESSNKGDSITSSSCKIIEQRKFCDDLRTRFNQPDTDISCSALERAELARTNSKKAMLLSPPSMMELNRILLSDTLPARLAPPLAVNWFDLFMLLTVWVAAGVLLAIALTRSVFSVSPRQRLASVKFTVKSALIALGSASLTMGAAILSLRILFLFWQLGFHTPAQLCVPWLFQVDVGRAGAWVIAGIISIPSAVIWVNSISPGSGWITLPICLVIALLAAGLSPKFESFFPKLVAISPLLGILIFGVGSVFGSTLFIMLLVMVTWAVPAFGLAGMLPYLEPTSALPRRWGAVALACGIALSIATIFLSNVPPIIFGPGCVSLIVLGTWVYWQQPLVRDAWPALAVTAAFCFMCTVFAQQATFSGVLNNLHSVTAQAPLNDDDNRCHMTQHTLAPFTQLHAALARPSAPQVVEFDQKDATEASKLEISLAGTFGFWIVIALLAAWALRKKDEEERLGNNPP